LLRRFLAVEKQVVDGRIKSGHDDREGPGSAAHHFMLRRARDTQPWLGITRARRRAARTACHCERQRSNPALLFWIRASAGMRGNTPLVPAKAGTQRGVKISAV
jgi:hypothetical protein